MKITLVSLFSFLLCYYCIYDSFQISFEDQQSLLIQLKNNLTFNPKGSTKLKMWNQSIACCNWSGVTCDSRGKVIGLDLSEEHIHGGFDSSSSLFSLNHLQKLNLAYNLFETVIPSGFSKLVMLNYLNFSHASFQGEIPIEISQLTNLITLHISGPKDAIKNVLTMKNQNLQKFVQNLTKIRQLYLEGITLTSEGPEWSNALLPLRELQELSMYNCDLAGPLDSSLSRLKYLSVIILDRNNFSSPVPETFANFKNLTTLSLTSCGLTGTFPQKIFQIEKLSVIDLAHNNNLHGSFPDIQLSGSLHTLRVSFTNFSGAIPHIIGNMSHLYELDLSNSQFNGTLPNSFSNLTELSYLDLSYNSFTGPIPSFSMAKNLNHIDLSYNSLSGEVSTSFHIEGLLNLVNLDLSYNSINGSISSVLFTLPYLKSIRLSFNHFSKLEEFTIISTSILESLELGSNDLSGPFPISILQLGSLYRIDLSSNKFTGSVQLDELFGLTSLSELHLSYNNLSISWNATNYDLLSVPNINVLGLASCNFKTFPSFLINQSGLGSLDLSDNQIHGLVPNWIWKLPYLDKLNISHNFFTNFQRPMTNHIPNLILLDLHNNQLQGPIPMFHQSAIYLDYSTNNFSVIPQDIGNYLSSTLFLSLSNNNIHGSFPHSLCNASNLQVLDLSINKISGTMPACLMTMAGTIEVINLSKNNLTGSIPDMFPASCVVRTLNINGNHLHGPLPKSLSHCSSLKVLDIGSNQILCGFPCFLKNIPILSVLVLRNNKFHGTIECSHSQADKHWKMLQIVDISFNNFNGKLQEKYFATWDRMMQDEDDVISDFIHTRNKDCSYYQDSVTVSIKGQQLKLVKILAIFTAIDFSSNHFEGPIPQVLMEFKAIHVLNFSNNGISGEIPSTIGNLKQLESLDLSNNSLVGVIPVQLANLSFLSYLNLSLNHLVGKIPTGTQLQSFQAASFEGNKGLYGPPLPEKPNGKRKDDLPIQPACERLACSIDWNFLSVELGFVFGLGIIIGPLLFWKKWRVGYWKLADKILCRIFRRMYFEYATDRGQTYRILRW